MIRLTEKKVSTAPDGTWRVQRRFDQPCTPFQRLCATEAISTPKREKLQQLRLQTNPRRYARRSMRSYRSFSPCPTPALA